MGGAARGGKGAHRDLRIGTQEGGREQVCPVAFFSTSEDVEGANNDLEVEIEEAILSDCEKTINAIHHAVIWGDARIIRDQLEKSKQSDAAGLAHAFTTALLQRRRSDR